MEEEETFCRFGTPLEPLEEEEVPSKKPVQIEDQIVKDVNGRRRFHGAFTGGFSAGFWNTVGSLEGWKPQNFKSSRSEKANLQLRNPMDFMDEEDLGEFGIAPQRVQTTDDFSTQEKLSGDARKRKFQVSEGPIPGVPVLRQLLQPAKENVARRLLRMMGWKEGQGVGARQTRKEKKVAAERNKRELYVMKVYGCEIGPISDKQPDIKIASDSENSESDFSDGEDITFAPDDYEPFMCAIKDNTFGLGYSGLNRDPVLTQHVNLFEHVDVVGKNNKKLSIRGQAFGVGALEEEDEDIYARDDMSKYDFSLESLAKSKKKHKESSLKDNAIVDGFDAAINDAKYKKKIFSVFVPDNFKARNWAFRRSRFEPLDEERMNKLKKDDSHKVKGLGRHDLNPEERKNILEGCTKIPSESNSNKNSKDKIEDQKNVDYLKKVDTKYKEKEKSTESSSKEIPTVENANDTIEIQESARKENEEIQSKAVAITKSLDKKPTFFKPFINNEAKQERYEKFVKANLKTDNDMTVFLNKLQPLSMTDWDREMEKKEFQQAQKIYKPLQGSMSNRFVSEAALPTKIEDEKPSDEPKKIIIKQTKKMWKPCSRLCKAFDIAQPHGSDIPDEDFLRKPRFSVFDYIEASVNTKYNFVTPVILPTKTERPKPIISMINSDTRQNSSQFFTKELTTTFLTATEKDVDIITALENLQAPTINTTTKPPPINIDRSREISRKIQNELEKKVAESKTKHPSEKKDLFKAIFESSSEDENDKEDEKSNNKSESIMEPSNSKPLVSSTKISDTDVLIATSTTHGIFAKKSDPLEDCTIQHLVEFNKEKEEEIPCSPKPNSENPPVQEIVKPIPQSVQYTNTEIESMLRERILFRNRQARLSEQVSEKPTAQIYGPAVPAQFSRPSENNTSTDDVTVDEKLLKLLSKSNKNKEVVEEWVEKDNMSTSSKKKKKKNKSKDKKEKKKSKKHKKNKR